MENKNSFKKEETEHLKQFIEWYNKWHVKNEFLKNQISQLEKMKDFPIFIFASFILKIVWIEFELKQLISHLDAYLSTIEMRSRSPLSRKIRMPKDLDKQLFTFGKLIKEINQYEGTPLNKLKNNLPLLNRLRKKFIHHLFSSNSSLGDLIKEAEKGLELTEIILQDINEIYKFLENNPPIMR
jgi:hypothetical protein